MSARQIFFGGLVFRTGDFVLAASLAASIWALPSIENSEVRGYAANVSASFAFAFIVRALEAGRELIYFAKFLRFFGRRFAANQFFVIYPEFQLASTVRDLAKAAGVHHQLLFQKAGLAQHPKDTFQVDLADCAATNDMRAMIEVSALFAKQVREPPRIAPDGDWDRVQEDAFVSIGFSSNYVTHNWLRLADKQIQKIDDAMTAKYREFIRLRTTDGEDEYRDFKSDESGEVGLIAKFRPDQDRPDITWFLCAGIGPDATVASAIFLSRKWRKLLRVFGTGDFILVVRALPGVVMHPTPLFGVQDGKEIKLGALS